MLKSQAAALKLSEIREKLNDLNAVTEPTDAQKTEERDLLASQKTTEAEYREALTSESEADAKPTADAETRERIDLRGKSRLGAFILAHMQGREPAGPEAEYRAALGIGAGIPVDLFEREPEIRADAASVAPTSGLGAKLAPIQPALFAPSIAPRLGIDMPQVGSGAYSEARISTSLTAGMKAKGVAAESTAAVLTTATASPRALTGRLTLQLEDIALIGQANFESALRANLQLVMSHTYDGQCINGDGVAPNVTGLIKLLTDPDNPTTIAGFDDYLQSFSDAIEGLWASELSQVSIVANVDAYKRSATPDVPGRGRGGARCDEFRGLCEGAHGRLVDEFAYAGDGGEPGARDHPSARPCWRADGGPSRLEFDHPSMTSTQTRPVGRGTSRCLCLSVTP